MSIQPVSTTSHSVPSPIQEKKHSSCACLFYLFRLCVCRKRSTQTREPTSSVPSLKITTTNSSTLEKQVSATPQNILSHCRHNRSETLSLIISSIHPRLHSITSLLIARPKAGEIIYSILENIYSLESFEFVAVLSCHFEPKFFTSLAERMPQIFMKIGKNITLKMKQLKLSSPYISRYQKEWDLKSNITKIQSLILAGFSPEANFTLYELFSPVNKRSPCQLNLSYGDILSYSAIKLSPPPKEEEKISILRNIYEAVTRLLDQHFNTIRSTSILKLAQYLGKTPNSSFEKEVKQAFGQ